jgi:pimeloyl-ACP methyl ester carboxylesterase
MQQFDLTRPQRRLAFRERGDPNGSHILVCLPGILETQSGFDALIPFYESRPGTRLITVDLCGRGHSEWLNQDERYSMSVYSEDLKQFLSHIHATHPRIQRKLTLLGNSMGAILALHLAADPDLKVQNIILNDMALSVSWSSLLGLNHKLQQSLNENDQADIIKELRIDPKLFKDIQQPAHLDIPHKLTFLGISFHNLANQYKGRIMLIRGTDSEVCTDLDHINFIHTFARSKTLTVSNASHPVQFTNEVIREMNHFMMGEEGHFDRCCEFEPSRLHIPQEAYSAFVVNA